MNDSLAPRDPMLRPKTQPNPKMETPDFIPPDKVAAADEQTASSPAEESNEAKEPKLIGEHSPPKKSWHERLKLSWPPSKREAIIIAVLIVIFGGGAAFALTRHHTPPAKPIAKVAPKPAAPIIVSPLTGLPVTAAQAKLPVTAVMIENSLPARPQAGLGSAGIVYEAIAEAGITRFMALYQEAQPDNVGPIRSARPYYLNWLLGYDASLAHVGGSPEALSDIKAWGVKDLDQFYNAGSYHRVSSRYAPHNVYTSIAQLIQLEQSKGYATSQFTGFPRKKDAPAAKPTAATINIAISGPDYNDAYSYNPKTNSYLRSEGGQPHIDANTNTQISPKVVIALIMPYSLGPLDSSGAYYSDYNNLGSGAAYVFQDGTVEQGTWSKADRTSPLTINDPSGQPIKLNAGQTWITALGDASEVSYQP